jgi:hypothetical protein
VTVLNAMTIHRQHLVSKVDNLKSGVDLMQGLLAKYSKEHKMTRPHADNKMEIKSHKMVLCATKMGKDEKQCISPQIVK